MPQRVIASETTILRDPALGINRKVFEGKPVPAGLARAYEEHVSAPKPAKKAAAKAAPKPADPPADA